MAGWLALLLAVLWMPLAQGDEGEADQARLEALQKEISDLQRRIERRDHKRSALNEELERRERAQAEIGRKMARLEEEAETLEQERRQLERKRRELEQARERQQEQVSRELATAYRLGREEPLKLLLNLEQPDKLMRTLRYYRYFLEARSDKLAEYRATLDELTDVEQAIADNQQRLARNLEELAAQERALEKAQQQRRQLLARLEEELASEQERLAKMNRERAELEEILAALEAEVQDLASPDTEPFPEHKGNLSWPVKGKVLQAFGSRRAANIPWRGWLMAAEEGEGVRSVHGGRVVFADYMRGHGLVLIIDHGDSYLSLYAHNQVLLKEAGDWVRAGEAVARVGRSGGLSDSALYFEIRHNGRPQDPKTWLAAR